MISLIYFDTNFFDNVIKGVITKKDLSELKSFIEDNNIKPYYSPISFTEIASHISREERDQFTHYKSVLNLIKDVCVNNILENPDHVLATLLKVPPPARKEGEGPAELNKVRDLICSAKAYDELVAGKICYWNGMLAKVKINEDYVKNFREDYEVAWVSDMYKFVLNVVNPLYLKRLRRGKSPRVTNKTHREQLIKFLDGIEFKKAFIDASFCKAMNLPEASLVGHLDERELAELIKPLSAYFTAYKTIIKWIIERGYGIMKNKNDFNDLHFLMYLGLGDHVRFISYDDKLKEKIIGCSQEKQVMKINDLLKEF